MTNKKVTLIGVSMLLLAILLVLGCVFVPILSARGEMKDTLRAALDGGAQYLLVSDPLYKTDDLLGNDGKEVMLDKTQAAAVREELSALCDGFSYAGKEQKILGAWDLNLTVKTAAGDLVRIYFTDTSFYCMKEDVALRFTPDDTAAYAALRTRLQETLQ